MKRGLIYNEEESEERMKVIAQNGNTGLHYDQVSTDMIDAASYSVSNEGEIGATYKPRDFDKQQLPDARRHQIISFIKSGVRILGYILLPFDVVAATVVLVISEVVGILEELV